MIRGAVANRAVESAIGYIRKMREAHDGLDRLVFCFPKKKMAKDSEFRDGSGIAVSAAAIARNQNTMVDKTTPVTHYGKEHSIASCFVPLKSIADVEVHVSKYNVKRLLEVGCIVFQRYEKMFGMRIPYDSPAFSGKPSRFQQDAEE